MVQSSKLPSNSVSSSTGGVRDSRASSSSSGSESFPPLRYTRFGSGEYDHLTGDSYKVESPLSLSPLQFKFFLPLSLSTVLRPSCMSYLCTRLPAASLNSGNNCNERTTSAPAFQ